MKKKILFVAACITGSTLFAQPAPQVREDSLNTLDPVIITANKILQKQSSTGKVITVITKEQIEKSEGKSLSEVLNQQAGLIISGANNTLGTNQSIYLQGASSANTLILLDGIPLYDASGVTSEFDLNNFSLNNIERIEILKGAQSTLYGSDAVAGVINIITKKSGIKSLNFQGIFSAGSYNTYKGSVALSGAKNGQTYSLSYSKIDSKGFSSAYDSTGSKHFDKDGFTQDAVLANFGFKQFKKLETRLYAKYNINKADIDAGAFADDKDYTYKNKNFITSVTTSYKLLKGSFHLNYNYNWFDRNFVDDSISVGGFAKYQKGNFKGRSHFGEVYSNWLLSKYFDLLAGIDYRRNSTDQNYFYFPNFGFLSPSLSSDSTKSNQVSGYASLMLKNLSGFNAEVGGRLNYHNIYGSNFTYSFNPSYLISNNLKLFANISSGYKAPSLYQLYSEFGNKNLGPETSISSQAGVNYFTDIINLRVFGFARSIKNVFAFYTNPITFAGLYINEDKQKDYGAEAEVSWRLSDKIQASANYTYIDGKLYTKTFAGKDTAYNNLYRRPAHTFNITLGYQASENLFVSTHFKAVSKFYEGQFAAAPLKMNGYYTLDVYGAYKLNNKLKIFADLQNITDKKYFDIRGFNSKRFNINAGINIHL